MPAINPATLKEAGKFLKKHGGKIITALAAAAEALRAWLRSKGEREKQRQFPQSQEARIAELERQLNDANQLLASAQRQLEDARRYLEAAHHETRLYQRLTWVSVGLSAILLVWLSWMTGVTR